VSCQINFHPYFLKEDVGLDVLRRIADKVYIYIYIEREREREREREIDRSGVRENKIYLSSVGEISSFSLNIFDDLLALVLYLLS